MNFTEREARLWSRMGSRAVFGLTTLELAKRYDDFLVLSADVRSSAGLEPLWREAPNSYLDVGIGEQNMIALAAGLASEGTRVVTTTFAPFETMRCCEQIRVNLAYMRQNVTMVGLAAGLALGLQGFTHCCFEDVGVLRSLPNLTIISPADCGATVKALFAAVEFSGPVYLRLTGAARTPIVYANDFDFQIGRATILRSGGDVGLIACGTMVATAMQTAERLEKLGISASVVDMHTIKPLDVDAVAQLASRVQLLATLEEHNIIGGLGSAVAEAKAGFAGAPPQLFFGVPDTYGKAGTYADLLDRWGLTPEKITDRLAVALAAVHRGESVS